MNVLWNLIQTFDMRALNFAAKKGYKEIVEMLLRQEDIDINAQEILNHKKFMKFRI